MNFSNAKMDDRPRRGFWAPGNYISKCRSCCDTFIGDKRAMECADCAYKKGEEVSPTDVGQKRIVSEVTFRSTPMVNQEDDMVRVTIDMKRTCWWGWKRQMFK